MKVKNFFKDEKGAVLPLVTIILGLFALGFMALVIDVGILYVERKAMITAADAAALAGAEVLREYEYKEKNLNYIDEAISEAEKYASTNGAVSCQVTVSENKKEVEVIATKNEDLIFARFLDHENTDVKAHAIAAWEYVCKTSIMPMFTFNANYDSSFDPSTDLFKDINLHDNMTINVNGNLVETNSYGFIAVGDGNKGMDPIKDAFTDNEPIGPYSVGGTLNSAPGDRNSVYPAVEKREGDTFLMPIIDINKFIDDNKDKTGLADVNSWKLTIKYFAYFTVTDVRMGNPVQIIGHFTGEKIESGTVGGTEINPNPSGVPTATYSKLIK